MDTNYIIKTKNLTKQYGSQKSVADLNIHPFSAALILVGFDMSEYAGTTISSTPLLAVIGVGIMVLWAVLLLLMSSNKKEMKSRKQANAKGKGKRAVRRKGR